MFTYLCSKTEIYTDWFGDIKDTTPQFGKKIWLGFSSGK